MTFTDCNTGCEMTPLERAEKIIKQAEESARGAAVIDFPLLHRLITKALDQFAEEARQHEHDRIREQHARDLVTAYNSGLEEAAKIADDEYYQGGDGEEGAAVRSTSSTIADAIRAKAKELK